MMGKNVLELSMIIMINYTCENIINLLNTLHEENTILKTTNGEMEDYLARLEEEKPTIKKKNEKIK